MKLEQEGGCQSKFKDCAYIELSYTTEASEHSDCTCNTTVAKSSSAGKEFCYLWYN